MKILGVIASTREDSLSAAALQVSVAAMRELGADVDVLDLRTTPLPLLAPASKSESLHFPDIKRRVDSAGAYILATPDYHGSMSGVLKNFLDYFWTEFAGKTFATICASHEKGLTAMDQIRTVVRQCYAWSLPYGVCIAREDVDDSYQVANPKKRMKLRMLGRDLVVYGSLIDSQRSHDLEDSDVATFMARYRSRSETAAQ